MLGTTAGLLVMYRIQAGHAEIARSAHTADARALEAAREELAGAQSAVSRLSLENDRLRADEEITRQQLAALRKQAEAVEATEPPGDPLPEIAMDSLLAGLLGPEPPEAAPDPASDEEEARRDRWGGEERAARFREMIQGYLGERLDNARSLAEQERIVAIMEYSQYLSDLRQSMYEAQSEEERELAREALYAGMRDVRQIMEEHRDANLAELAARFGIEDPDRQRAFSRQIEQLMRDPLLGGGFMGGGRGAGGPPGRGWGRGGAGPR